MPKPMTRREILKAGAAASGLAAIGVPPRTWSTLPERFLGPAPQQPDLILRNGLIVTADGRLEADVRIRGERIVEIGRNLAATGGARVIEARGMLLLPGRHRHAHASHPRAAESAATQHEHG